MLDRPPERAGGCGEAAAVVGLPELVEAFRPGIVSAPLPWVPEGRAEYNRAVLLNLLGLKALRDWVIPGYPKPCSDVVRSACWPVIRSAPRLSAVHRVEQRLVIRLHGLALDLHAGCQLALLDRQVPVEDPEVLHGLPAVEPAVEFLDAGLHVPADRRVPGQRGVAAGGQAPRPSPLVQPVGVEGDQRGRVVAPVRVHQ